MEDSNQRFGDVLRILDPDGGTDISGLAAGEVEDSIDSEQYDDERIQGVEDVFETAENKYDDTWKEIKTDLRDADSEEEFKETYIEAYMKSCLGKFIHHDIQNIVGTIAHSMVDRSLLYSPEIKELYNKVTDDEIKDQEEQIDDEASKAAGRSYALTLLAKDRSELEYVDWDATDGSISQEIGERTPETALDLIDDDSSTGFSDLVINWDEMEGDQTIFSDDRLVDNPSNINLESDSEYGSYAKVAEAFINEYELISEHLIDSREGIGVDDARLAGLQETKAWWDHKTRSDWSRPLDPAMEFKFKTITGLNGKEEIGENKRGEEGPIEWTTEYVRGIQGHDRNNLELLEASAARLGKLAFEGRMEANQDELSEAS